MNIKKGDTVAVRVGKDRGKTGKVLAIFREKDRVSVEGINLVKKHSKPKRQGEKGETVLLPRPMHASNLMLYCSSCSRGVRVGRKREGEGSIRYCKRCNATL
jgi:large subunit ribosomal protein L24